MANGYLIDVGLEFPGSLAGQAACNAFVQNSIASSIGVNETDLGTPAKLDSSACGCTTMVTGNRNTCNEKMFIPFSCNIIQES